MAPPVTPTATLIKTLETMRRFNENQTHAADHLKISRGTLQDPLPREYMLA